MTQPRDDDQTAELSEDAQLKAELAHDNARAEEAYNRDFAGALTRVGELERRVDTLAPLTDTVVAGVIQRYRDRAQDGWRKYGTTLDRDDLQPLDWVVHAQEEAMDLSVYLERLRREVPALVRHQPWAQVEAFHRKYSLPVGRDPGVHPGWWNRIRLMQEELQELECSVSDYVANNRGSREDILKEWADLLFVVWGTAVEFGFDGVAVEAFNRVAASNMTKDGEVNGDGKLTKGPDYREPNMDGLWIP